MFFGLMTALCGGRQNGRSGIDILSLQSECLPKRVYTQNSFQIQQTRRSVRAALTPRRVAMSLPNTLDGVLRYAGGAAGKERNEGSGVFIT
jgi:hypothetical protein